jgi:Spy/CpxP family protein refolding chaperone
MTNQPKRLALLYLGLVFVAGTLLGAALDHFYTMEFASAEMRPAVTSPEDHRQHLISKFTKDLDLRPEQVAQLNPILEDIDRQYSQYREDIEPGFDAIRAERARRVMAILDPGQQVKYQQILDARKSRREANRKLEMEKLLKQKKKDECH